MNHTSDQDLLLLAHRSLGLPRSIAAHLHISRCSKCKKRLSELNSLSLAAASAIRTGMPAWKPLGLKVSTKLLLIGLIIGGSLLGAQMLEAYSERVTSSHNVPVGVDGCVTPSAVSPHATISKYPPIHHTPRPLSAPK